MAKKTIPKSRMLSPHEMETLRFLWKWKLANYQTLKAAIAPSAGKWRFYKKIRRLFLEGYIQEAMDGDLKIPLWTLTKKGFLSIKDSLGLLSQARFQPQSVPHDFWAAAFQLGDFALNLPPGCELLSEQEVNAGLPEVLPDWIPKSKNHIPDGYSRIVVAKGPITVAFETELSQKEMVRYEEMIGFLDHNEEIDLVLWLCRDPYLIQKITQRIVGSRRYRPAIHNFVQLSDFKRLGWQSPILWGGYAKQTVSSIMGQDPGQNLGQSTAKPRPEPAISLFIENSKSPMSLKP